MLSCLALAGCDDPAPAPHAEAEKAPPPSEFSATGKSWIEIHDKVSPAVWLASREAGRDVGSDDPAATSLRVLLNEADMRFSENPRMIANRAVQVQSMLAERGVTETPRTVIEGLVSIGEIGERAAFGETCQHYVNARAATTYQPAALAALKSRPLPVAKPGDEPR